MTIDSLYLGAYWGPRLEPRAAVAARLVRFLQPIGAIAPELAAWFVKRASGKAPTRVPIDLTTKALEPLLATNDRDIGGEAIGELGFRIALWNGGNATLSCTLGSLSPTTTNAVVLSFVSDAPDDPETWRRIARVTIESFNPERLVVADPMRDEQTVPASWLAYERGAELVECPDYIQR
jgi:hypothetical protein